MSNYSNFKHSSLTQKIIKAGYEVYNYFGGPGLPESCYEGALEYELQEMGYKVDRQFPIEVYYKTRRVGQFFADLVIEDYVILELKAVSEIIDIHQVQLLNYLRSTQVEVGLLMNFGHSEKLELKRKIFDNHLKIDLGRIP
jgi:GxxExxY protein